MDDFRVKTGFNTHPKIQMLKRRAGKEGVYSLLVLWSHAARYKPDGVFSNMSSIQIEMAADWEGPEYHFVDDLISCGLLEHDKDNNLMLHDWLEHNPEAASYSNRFRQIKQAAANHLANRNSSM